MSHTYTIKAQDQEYNSVQLQQLADYINGLGRITVTRTNDDIDSIELVKEARVEGSSLAVDTV